MKKSLKTFSSVDKYNGYTILIYGELWEEGYIDGMIVQRAKFSKDGRKVMDLSMDHEGILLNRPYTRTRYFNMGWAICSPEDKFDENIGIEICKRRFRKSPLRTETGLFLTKDMVQALIENEIKYIKSHWSKFVHPTDKAENTVMKAFKAFADSVSKKKGESDINVWKEEKDEPTSYTEADSLTDEEKLMRKPPMFGSEETNDNSDAKEPGIGPGSYVRVLSKNEQEVPFTVAYVKDVDDNGIYCLWSMKFNDIFSSFRVNNTYFDTKTYSFRLATNQEVSDTLKEIEKKTSFHWNVSEKRLEFKYV